MNVINFNEYTADTIRMTPELVDAIDQAVNGAVEIVGKDYFVSALCEDDKELSLVA